MHVHQFVIYPARYNTEVDVGKGNAIAMPSTLKRTSRIISIRPSFRSHRYRAYVLVPS